MRAEDLNQIGHLINRSIPYKGENAADISKRYEVPDIIEPPDPDIMAKQRPAKPTRTYTAIALAALAGMGFCWGGYTLVNIDRNKPNTPTASAEGASAEQLAVTEFWTDRRPIAEQPDNDGGYDALQNWFETYFNDGIEPEEYGVVEAIRQAPQMTEEQMMSVTNAQFDKLVGMDPNNAAAIEEERARKIDAIEAFWQTCATQKDCTDLDARLRAMVEVQGYPEGTVNALRRVLAETPTTK